MTNGLSKTLVVAVSVAAVIIGVAFTVPLGSEEEPVVYEEDLGEKTTVILGEGESYTRSFPLPNRPIRGLVVFSPSHTGLDGGVVFRLSAGGRLLAETSDYRVQYRNDSYHLVVPIKTFSLPEKTEALLTVTRLSGGDLPLKITQESGALTLSLLHPAPLDFGARQGVLLGGAILLAIVLIGYLPRYKWIAAGLLIVVVTPLVLAGFLFPIGELGISDWDYYFTVHESYRRTLYEHQSFPFWNPYTCGAMCSVLCLVCVFCALWFPRP